MNMRCRKCDLDTHLIVADRYEVPRDKLGIEGVVIVGGYVRELYCKHCKDVRVVIPDLPGLIAATAVARVKMPWKLDGDEIRFLRKALGISATDLAEKLEVTIETVSRWENGKLPIGPSNEKLLRMNVGLGLAEKAPGIRFDQNEIVNMKVQAAFDSKVIPKMEFSRILVVNQANDRSQEEEVWRKAA